MTPALASFQTDSMKHVLEAQQFNKKLIGQVFEMAERMEQVVESGGNDLLRGKVMASVFYTISTRTRLSFEAAMLRLGGKVISTEHPEAFSDTVFASNLEDTVRMVDRYVDVIVLRHPEEGSTERAAKVSRVPVINAGGGGQHPTQALLDLYTIYRAKDGVDGVSVLVMGNLANSRTGRSLCYLLAKYSGVKIWLVSPEELSMRQDIIDYLERHQVSFVQIHEPGEELEQALQQVEVVYQTDLPRDFDYGPTGLSRQAFCINMDMLGLMRKHAIIMHPFPRMDGIAPEVDTDPRAHYFQQITNGLYIRMALLQMILAPETLGKQI